MIHVVQGQYLWTVSLIKNNFIMSEITSEFCGKFVKMKYCYATVFTRQFLSCFTLLIK